MTGRIANRMGAILERLLPEQRLFLRSDTETRFIRLRPTTQAIALGVSALVVAWTIVATAILLMDSIGSGNLRDQANREQLAYETRLNELSAARDARAEEAVRAQDRFNIALDQISTMQSALLASEDRRKELETGIEVIQKTLRRTIRERDDARKEIDQTKLALAKQTGSDHTDAGRAKTVAATLDILTDALSDTATERDRIAAAELQAEQAADAATLDKKLMIQRNDKIFAKLEQAVTVSMAPLDKMFRAAGLNPQSVLDEVRRGYSGEGGPLTPIAFSSKGVAPSQEEVQANSILASLDRMNLYRLAAQKVPLGLPLKTSFRYTSPYGYRTDPLEGGNRFHAGQDLAGDYGSPVYSTADGVVIKAGWSSGYGREVEIQHAFGMQTVYGHLSQIRVTVGQRVSRGTRIGDMGNSGRSTGTHLHYEVHAGGKPVNPMTYIKAATNVF